ncbi:MAG TPA: histidine--tRNA ligase [Anaerolineae bacterium]|nr:histidine--tRNA ligase [Anaerolineae bacterium]HQH37710.1 histidine--tRNA ligase [Anaerolineae bacterium]
MVKFTRPTGTQDILPEEQPYWDHVLACVAAVARDYGFARIDIPIFETTEVFARGVGAGTDIVDKEMYSFKDKGGNDITLRPEFTAGVMRAYIENGMHVLPKPIKLYSTGPVFRYERPQAGRYRQLYQFNAEIIGEQNPLADLEIMLIAWDIYAKLEFANLSFQLNTTGCPVCRPGYIEHLRAHYRTHYSQICDDCKLRLDKNPLRVLDCKREQCQPVIAAAPKISDYVCDDCATHFADLRTYLDDLGKPYTINHRLVRGLDYYTKTVFEVWAEGIGAQSAVCGGGRYDGLIELLGGAPTPGVGFAAGIERAVLLLKAQNIPVPLPPSPPVFIAYLGDAARRHAVRLLVHLHQAGFGAQIAMSGSLKSQLRQADKRGARLALLIGEDEIAQGGVTLRDMASGEQESVPLGNLVDAIQQRLV